MEQYIRNSTADDIEFLSTRLRPEDEAEVRAQGANPLLALSLGLQHSDICWTLVDRGGTPVGMMGVSPCMWSNTFGAIWLLGTKGIEENTMTFLKHSKRGLNKLFDLTHYDAFYNVTYAKNALHHQWLKWLGFTFLRECSVGDEPFYEFVKLRG